MYHINTDAHVHLMKDNQSVNTEGAQYILILILSIQ